MRSEATPPPRRPTVGRTASFNQSCKASAVSQLIVAGWLSVMPSISRTRIGLEMPQPSMRPVTRSSRSPMIPRSPQRGPRWPGCVTRLGRPLTAAVRVAAARPGGRGNGRRETRTAGSCGVLTRGWPVSSASSPDGGRFAASEASGSGSSAATLAPPGRGRGRSEAAGASALERIVTTKGSEGATTRSPGPIGRSGPAPGRGRGRSEAEGASAKAGRARPSTRASTARPGLIRRCSLSWRHSAQNWGHRYPARPR